jgi:hypothetical protein
MLVVQMARLMQGRYRPSRCTSLSVMIFSRVENRRPTWDSKQCSLKCMGLELCILEDISKD